MIRFARALEMLDTFFITDTSQVSVEPGSYEIPLVVLSYVVASIASYMALAVAQMLAEAETARDRLILRWGGAFTMGAGIWSMHFIGMLSYDMNMVVTYQPGLTILSLIIAIAASWGALDIVARDRLPLQRLLVGGTLMGFGICAMHYTGMLSMKMDGDLRYTPGLFALSVAIAIAASVAALWISFKLARHAGGYRHLFQALAALIMGAAISGMHYTGMAAAVFIPWAQCRRDPNQDFTGLALSVAAVTGLIFCVALAVGSYKKAEAERKLKRIEKSRALLAAIVESSDDAMLSMGLDGTLTSWNAAAHRLYGYAAEEAVGRNILFVVPPERTEEENFILSQIRDGKSIEHYETERVRKDGKRVAISLTVSPIRDSLGNITGASKVARDISERKEAEAELLRYMKALERSNQELDDFAHIASHDMKEPLRGLVIQANFLSEDYADKLDDQGKRRLQRLMHLSQRMERLVSDLLYYSQLGRAEMAVQETDLNEAVGEIRHMLEQFLKERNGKIVVPKPLPPVVCDRVRVTEVLRNLITNAIKYNDKPERVAEVGFIDRMQTEHGPETNVFYVRDNGVGIPREYHQEVFRIFRRLSHSDDKETGTGAGLTFVKKIIERHMGNIWIESTPGEGTTFYFTLKQGARPS